MGKSIGMMRPFDFPHLDVTVDGLGRLVDEMVFLVDRDAPPETLRVLARHPKTVDVIEWTGRWTQGPTLEALLSIVGKMSPEFVFYPDDDELLPDEGNQMRELIRKQPTVAGLMFPMIYPWHDPDTIIAGMIDNHHMKVCRWFSEASFHNAEGRYHGCTCVVGARALRYPKPLRHLRTMTPEALACHIRHQRRGVQGRKLDTAWEPERTVPFDAGRTWAEWLALFEATGVAQK